MEKLLNVGDIIYSSHDGYGEPTYTPFTITRTTTKYAFISDHRGVEIRFHRAYNPQSGYLHKVRTSKSGYSVFCRGGWYTGSNADTLYKEYKAKEIFKKLRTNIIDTINDLDYTKHHELLLRIQSLLETTNKEEEKNND